jgi:DeoR/GlpR family transcriptional regulator of sugar metabolism
VLKSEAIELNFRQVKLMRKLNRDEAISVRDYMMRNSVCSMTAYRDLKELFLAGKLVRVGKGRSTVYLRADSAFEQSK